jgi:hypothetical protein
LSDEKRFLLRLDPSVYRALRKWADDELRSVNGQIEFLLRKALKEAGRGKAAGGEGRGQRSGPDETD